MLQIVVFPEFGLYNPDTASFSCKSPAVSLAAYCEPVPEPAAAGEAAVNPCDSASPGDAWSVVAATSCMGKNASIVASVNMCEAASDGK